MKFKKLAALTLAGAMSLSLAACGGGGDTASPAPNTGAPSAATDTPAPEGEVYKIGVLAPEVTHGWSAGVAYYAEKRCDELEAEGKIEKKILISGDAAEMTTQLDELKTWGADAIVAFPQWEGMEVPIQQAIDEGITVVNFDIAIEADGVYRVSGDNEGMGKDAAEYIMSEGNYNVVLCERGIRTFETATRNTLDVSAVPVVKERSSLPIIIDPSHAAGRRDMVQPLSRAAIAAGADGLIIEAHNDPAHALCDGAQSLDLNQFDTVMKDIKRRAEFEGRVMMP